MFSLQTVILCIAMCTFLTTTYPGPQAFFGPDPTLSTRLTSLLCNAHKRILVASYMLTSKKLVIALLSAHKRGARIEVITDQQQCLSHRGRQVLIALKRAGITPFVSRHGSSPSLMHHKFAVIDNKVWIGSMNWTSAGIHRNYENALLLDARSDVARLTTHFHTLKQRILGTRLTTSGSALSSILFIPDHHKIVRTLLHDALGFSTVINSGCSLRHSQ